MHHIAYQSFPLLLYRNFYTYWSFSGHILHPVHHILIHLSHHFVTRLFSFFFFIPFFPSHHHVTSLLALPHQHNSAILLQQKNSLSFSHISHQSSIRFELINHAHQKCDIIYSSKHCHKYIETTHVKMKN